MGNKICVCDGDSHNEKESNIFSILSKTNTNRNDELKTLALENKATQGSCYKSFMDDNSSLNNKLDNFLSEIYKSNKNSQKIEEEIIPETNREDNNFHCSGKFEIPKNNMANSIPNGKTNMEDNIMNNGESKEINNNGKEIIKNNNQLGFVSFKSLIVDNNHNIHLKDNRQNKDNNMTISNEYNKIKESDVNKSITNNNNELIKMNTNKNNENGNPLHERNINYGQLRYNDISKYSDVSDEDYLNYESNYTNSNKREENRDEQSLFDEEQDNNL